MYARQPPAGRFPRPLHVPTNYSGNAFSSDTTEKEEVMTAPQEAPPSLEAESDRVAPTASSLFSSPGFRLDLGRLFRRDGGGGIGMEELLLIGLILLLSQSETRDDLILLLLILLFVQ